MAVFFWTATGAATSPATGANWTKSDGTTGTAPTTGDTAIIQPVPGVTLAPILYADMSAVTLAALIFNPGLPQTLTSGTTDTTSANFFGYWKISATSVVLNSGPGRIKLNLGSAASTVTVFGTGSSLDSGFEAVRLLLNSASSNVYVLGGTVGIATNMAGETATIGTVATAGSQAVLDLSSGVTVTTINAAGGTINANCGATTLNVSSGAAANISGSSGITTVNSTGTTSLSNRPACTTLNQYAGTTDFSGNPATATVTTANVYGGIIKRFPPNPGHITFTTLNPVLVGSMEFS